MAIDPAGRTANTPGATGSTGQVATTIQSAISSNPKLAQYIQQEGLNPQTLTPVQFADAAYNALGIAPPQGTHLENGHVVEDQPGFLDNFANAMQYIVPIAMAVTTGYGALTGGLTGTVPSILNTVGQKAVSTAEGAMNGPSNAASGGGGNTSLLNSIFGAAGDVAPVLTGAAAAGQRAQQINDELRLQAAQQGATLPGTRLSTSLRSSLLGNYTPSKVSWGGPGSGLRGEVPTFTGGIQAGLQNLDPKTKQLAQQTIEDMLTQELNGNAGVTPVGQSSTGDKILGGLGLGTSILGAAGKSGILGKLFGGTNTNGLGSSIPDSQFNDPGNLIPPDVTDPAQYLDYGVQDPSLTDLTNYMDF